MLERITDYETIRSGLACIAIIEMCVLFIILLNNAGVF
jgi:hypothetical protein